MSTRPKVLLVWPGSEGAAAGNFGVPQLVGLAGYLRARASADVTVCDLACERAFGKVDLAKLFAGPDGRGYDVIGFSVYSSFDYLLVSALAEIARAAHPRAVLVAGGYHVSARPKDIVYDGSPFDVAVVGEGEKPMTKVVESVRGGAPIRGEILGPDPITRLDDLPETDYGFLARYKPIARKVASQVEVYLSRGCPFDCAFCMEKAKREVSWRGYSVDRAIDELKKLHAFLGLSGWTVYFADALFGMPKAWRREFLSKLSEVGLPSEKNWLLIRVDMVDDEDLRLFRAANCAPGFGLESGDPEMLATIRKAGRLHDYLDRMLEVGRRAHELGVPWGANVIVGHPGETEASMRASAAYMRRLFLEPEATTGFLSIDPFRFYPGSPIDDELDAYGQRFGTKVHRPEWWKDGDQAFLSEWVDPSRELTYSRRDALMKELFEPILRELPSRFAYAGPSRPYFLRALEGQLDQLSDRSRLYFRERYYAWSKYTGKTARARDELANDTEVASLLGALRARNVAQMARTSGDLEPSLVAALVEVPRERFVPPDELVASTKDVAVRLDRAGHSSVSAFHAYATTFTAAGIREGMRVLDLGAGTGYGTALLARLVGARGLVRGVELDPALVAVGQQCLQIYENAELLAMSAFSPEAWDGPPWDAVVVGFAVDELPELFLARLGRAVLVLPVTRAGGEGQVLERVEVRGGEVVREPVADVLYVPARTRVEAKKPAPPPAPAPRTKVRLKVVGGP